ncbi:MAG: nitroreductase family protein [Spirochaetes bacterium]|jgi:nitroreductase|nr:nitroreductase family protein [Spirochaetota bacterium]
MEVLPEILGRRSVRSFTSKALDRDQVERILEAGRLAPSAKNRQEWRFVVVQKKETRQRIMEASFNQEAVGQAPAIIAVCTTNIDYRMPNGQLSYPVDLAFAASFMVLQAVHEGLGTCCMTTFDEQEVREILTTPFSMRIVLLLLVGYPAETPEPTPRKPLRQVSGRDHW